jgi:hypothetical protein
MDIKKKYTFEKAAKGKTRKKAQLKRERFNKSKKRKKKKPFPTILILQSTWRLSSPYNPTPPGTSMERKGQSSPWLVDILSGSIHSTQKLRKKEKGRRNGDREEG